jgi:nucleotide-binding universal stress UspA family protein
MTMPERRRILIALDGGSGSRAALRWVADHPGSARPEIVLVCVAADGMTDADADAELHAAELVLRTLLEGARTERHVRHGHAVDQLALAVTEFDADLLVIGTHASPTHPRSGRITVAGRLAARAACVVVVVPDDWTRSTGHVVVGNSIDAASDRALQFAADFAADGKRELVVTHVWELPTVGEISITPGGTESIPERQAAALDEVVRRAAGRAAGITVRPDLRRGDPVKGLIAAAAGAALLVVGRRERGPIASILGSTSRGVVSAPPCPVAVVPEYL